ncbi:hypothetical protein LIER_44125 [Lithospermum erythrorhizon]|uniref:Uncharacterized protein n=1 Tax=Lithospermum erythrorhizon TaxID=34254 RepID=A0AAV3Q0M4_LITER
MFRLSRAETLSFVRRIIKVDIAAIKDLSSFLELVRKADIVAEEIENVVNKKVTPYIYAEDISTVEYEGAGNLKWKLIKSYLMGMAHLLMLLFQF